MIENVRIEGLDKATAEVRAAVHAGVVSGAEALGVLGQKQVIENIKSPNDGMPPAVASGNLAASVDFTVTVESAFTRLMVFAGPPADTYVDPVNLGARPHMMPVEALLPWIRQKFGVEEEKTALSMAWAIAKSIAKKGMRGRQMFTRAETTIEPQAASIIERQIAASLNAAGLGGGLVTA